MFKRWEEVGGILEYSQEKSESCRYENISTIHNKPGSLSQENHKRGGNNWQYICLFFQFSSTFYTQK